MSHTMTTPAEPIPIRSLRQLQAVAMLLDDVLQSQGHLVEKVGDLEPSFDQTWIESVLRRALLGAAVETGPWQVQSMQFGGREILITEAGVERRFRLRSAFRDASGRLVVTAGSESILSRQNEVLQGVLFGPPPVVRSEQWVLAYVIDRQTKTLAEVVAAKPFDFANGKPGRLRFSEEIAITFASPEPRPFRGQEDDLELPDVGDRNVAAG